MAGERSTKGRDRCFANNPQALRKGQAHQPPWVSKAGHHFFDGVRVTRGKISVAELLLELFCELTGFLLIELLGLPINA
jgi:hypothetical protein